MVDCDHGNDGNRYKTALLEPDLAFRMLAMHRQDAHDEEQVGGGTADLATRSKVEKVKRPILKKGISEDKYLHFSRQWQRYKRSSGMKDLEVVRDQLISCCEEELSEDLENLYGSELDNKTEEQLLTMMRQLAVVAQNHLVNMMRLRALVQDSDESVRSYLARLKGAASVCKLTVMCTCDPSTSVSYADKEILHCLLNGLADKEIRKQVLGKLEVMSLDDTVKFIEAKESGRQAGAFLDGGEVATNKITSYKKNLKDQVVTDRVGADMSEEKKCRYCGKKGHGAAPTLVKKREVCPAFDRKCNTCGEVGHFSRTKACKKLTVKVDKVDGQNEMEARNMRLMTVGAVKDSSGKIVELSDTKPVPHMMDVDGKFVVGMPRSHPALRVQVAIDVQAYKELGLSLRLNKSFMTKQGKLLQVPRVDLLCDTGAQVDCVGVKRLRSLGLAEGQLLKPEVGVGCANGTAAEVVGIFFGKVTAMNENRQINVRVMFYVLKKGGDLLSRHTCERLGVIDAEFPKVGKHLHEVHSLKSRDLKNDGGDVYQEVGVCDPDSPLPCRCPRRRAVDPPERIPFPANTENRARLEEWIKDYYSDSAFSQCKRQTMPCTEGPPMRIHTDPNAVPLVVHKPIAVPLHYRAEVKANIDADVKRGVLEKVPPGVPVTWCTRMVITPKKDGRPRRTVDLSALTRAGVRETHHTRTPFKVVCSIPQGMYKTTLDCVDGFHGIPLAEEDRHKTTFITEWGRYRYARVPQGYGSSTDGYTIRTDDILATVPGKPEKCDYEKIVDDVIQWSGDLEAAFHRVCSMLSHCSKAGMVFSPSKFVFGAQEVEFAGFVVGSDCIRPTPRYLRSIMDFPTPKNLSDVRSWFGLINQVAFTFSKGAVMAPFRDLLKPSVKFEWTEQLDRAFQESKLEIVRMVENGVKMYDPELVTCLSSDFCKTGLGWILQQKICECEVVSPRCCNDGWRLVLAGGRFTIPAETRYSPTEGEALAVAVGLESSRYYTLGCPRLYIATDHKPLISILGDRALDTVVNPRLLKIKERTLAWRYDMVYVPGKKQAAADTLSRRKCEKVAGLALLTIESGGMHSLEDSLSMDMKVQLQELRVMPELVEDSIVECEELSIADEQQAGAMSVLAEPTMVS